MIWVISLRATSTHVAEQRRNSNGNTKFTKGQMTITMVLFFLLLVGCGRPEVTIVVKNPEKGAIFINERPISELVKSRSGNAEGDSLYFLDIPHGRYTFKFIFLDGSKLEKTITIESGEAYFTVDLSTGTTHGFL